MKGAWQGDQRKRLVRTRFPLQLLRRVVGRFDRRHSPEQVRRFA
jgi:hypothetical protein